MNRYSIFKRTIMIIQVLSIIIAFSSLGSECFAGGAANRDTGFDGSWTGEVFASGRTHGSVVNLTLQKTGKSTLTYESPRSCVLTVTFLKNYENKGREYSITESTGGFCDKVLLGRLSLRIQEDNSLSCELTSLDDNSSTEISEKGTLRRSGREL